MIQVGELNAPITLDSKPFEQGLRKAEKAGEKAADAIGARFKAVGKQIRNVGVGLTGALTAPLVGVGFAAYKATDTLNKGMANVATLIPKASGRVIELRGEVQRLQVAFGKTSEDLTGGLYQTISAFGDTADTVKILETNAKAATAGLSTTEEAIALTSAVTKAYGDTSAAAVEQVADLGLLTVRLGQTTFPELAGAIGQVSPIASAAGVSMQELFAVFATGTGVTGQARHVATQMRGALLALIKPNENLAKLYKQVGIESGAAFVEQYGFFEALNFVSRAAKETGSQMSDYISTVESLPLVLALTGGQADTFKQKLAEMGISAGTTGEAFDVMTKGVNAAGFRLSQMRQRISVLLQDLGDRLLPSVERLLPTFQKLAESLADTVEWFGKLSPRAQHLAIKFAAAVAIIGPALVVIGQAVTAIGTIAPVLTTVAAAMTGPAGLTVALGLVIAGFADLILEATGAKKAIADFFDDWATERLKYSAEGGILVDAFKNKSHTNAKVRKVIRDQYDAAYLQYRTLIKSFREKGIEMPFEGDPLEHMKGRFVTDEYAREFARQLAALKAAHHKWVKEIGAYQPIGPGIGVNALDGAEGVDTLKDSIDELDESLANLGNGVDAATQIQEIIDNLKVARDTFGMTAEQQALYTLGTLNASDAAKADAQAVIDELDALRQKKEVQEELDRILRAHQKPLDRYLETTERVHAAYIDGSLKMSHEQYLALLERIATSYGFVGDEAEDGFSRAIDAGEKMNEFAIQAARSIQSIFADFLFDPFEDGVKGMLTSFTTMLRRMVAEMLAQALLKKLFGAMNKSGGGTGFWASLASVFVGARAEGGYLSGPGTGTSDSMLARVSNGEYILRAAAVRKIGVPALDALNQGRMPAFASGGLVGGGMGGGAMTVNIDARGADAGVEGRLQSMFRTMERRVIERATDNVAREYQRGGKLREVLRR